MSSMKVIDALLYKSINLHVQAANLRTSHQDTQRQTPTYLNFESKKN